MAAIPLDIAVRISSTGAGAFRTIQEAMAGVGTATKSQAARGLQDLGVQMATASGLSEDLSMMMLSAGEIMTTFAHMAGVATPKAIARLANLLEGARMQFLDTALAEKGLSTETLTLARTMHELTSAERRAIQLLARSSTVVAELVGSWDSLDQVASKTGESVSSTARTMGREFPQAAERASRGAGVFGSAVQGLMLTLAALRGNLFGVLMGLRFLHRATTAITLPVAAIATAVFGLAGAFVRAGRQIESTRRELAALTGGMDQATEAFRNVRAWVRATGRSFEEVRESAVALHREGLLTGQVLRAVFTAASATGETATDITKKFIDAVGEEKANLEALRDIGVRVNEDLVDTTSRRAVTEAASAAILERYPDAYRRMAESGQSAWTRISSSIAEAWSYLARPVWEDLLVPFLQLLARGVESMADLVRAFMQNEAVIEFWNQTVDHARSMVSRFFDDSAELSNFLRMVFIGTLWALLYVIRGLIAGLDLFLTTLSGVIDVLETLGPALKPVIDLLGTFWQVLKELNWERALQGAKVWSLEFPDVIWTGLATALAYIVGGPWLALGTLLWNILVDSLIEILPIREELRRSLHHIFDWTMLFTIIGSFFGAGSLAIYAGAGLLVGVLDEAFKLGIHDWFERNLPYIFPVGLVLGAIGYLAGGPVLATIGFVAATLLAAFAEKLGVPLEEWLADVFPTHLLRGILFGIAALPIAAIIGALSPPLAFILATGTGIAFSTWAEEFPSEVRDLMIATGLGTALGAAIGGVLLGPVGLALGAAVGATLGSVVATIHNYAPAVADAITHPFRSLKIFFTETIPRWFGRLLDLLASLPGVSDDLFQEFRQTLAQTNEEIEQTSEQIGRGALEGAAAGIQEAQGSYLPVLRRALGQPHERAATEMEERMEGLMEEYQASYRETMIEADFGEMAAIPSREIQAAQAEVGLAPIRERLEQLRRETDEATGAAMAPPRVEVPARAPVAPGAAAPVNIRVNVTGNYIMDEETVDMLANKVGRRVMQQMTNRWGLRLPRR